MSYTDWYIRKGVATIHKHTQRYTISKHALDLITELKSDLT